MSVQPFASIDVLARDLMLKVVGYSAHGNRLG